MIMLRKLASFLHLTPTQLDRDLAYIDRELKNAGVRGSSAAVGNTLSNVQEGNPYALPGEAFWINTSSGTAGQNAWLTVLEVPIV